ncbi:MAG: DNA/RNA non-specific endonuclease [Sphingobacterium mizutaii]|nr:DNA/RNA non-specific endonuclease [Sphingobacterium mizutaii]
MIKRLFFVLAVALLFLGSCRKDFSNIQVKQEQSVLFTSKITGQVQTRMSGTQWDEKDSISIFMYQGEALKAGNVIPVGFNKQFITQRNGNFSPKTSADAIDFPKDKQVKFVAFYPFQRRSDLQRELNISNQQQQATIDYMIGHSANAMGYQQGPVQLNFERLMAKIQVRVKGVGINAVNAKISSLRTEAIFQIDQSQLTPRQVSKDVEGKVLSTGLETVIEWVIFPGKLSGQSVMVFTSNKGDRYTWEIGKLATDYVRGNRYQYSIDLTDDGTVDPNPTVSYMELPVISNSADLEYNFKMTPDRSKRNFSMLYDKKNRIAHWVAYPLSGDYLGGQSRTDNWAYDPSFSNFTQPLLSRGFGIGGIDRGHQIPSADRTKNYAENSTTFYYTNMTAQNSSLNQGLWARLENQIRSWARNSGVDTMYVVTGAGIRDGNAPVEYVKDNRGEDVAKPKYYYKALAVKRGQDYYTIGFYMENKATQASAHFNSYRMTVAELERKTGHRFFPGLPEATKSMINNAIWR